MPTSSRAKGPLVTVVVPVRNEAPSIPDAIRSLAQQDLGPEALEVIVVDGRSTDGSKEVCQEWAADYPWGSFKILENPQLTAPHALNAGLRSSTCRWYTRLDARARMASNYLSCCIGYLERADDPLRAAAGRLTTLAAPNAVSRAIAAALSHPVGVGRTFRTIVAEEAEVEHHPFAVWRTETVAAVGGFDETLTRNQDDEFSNRARATGARIVMLGATSIAYLPRERFRGLASQYFQFGLWKAAVGRRRGYFPLRSTAPAGLSLFVLVVPFAPCRLRRVLMNGLVAGYACLGAVASRGGRGAHPVLVGWALLLMHFSYGLGVLLGALRPELTRGRLGSARIR